MLIFEQIASSSAGNLYLLHAPHTKPLLIEAGLPIAAITERVSLGGLSGLLVSHEHKDHSASAAAIAARGVLTVALPETARKIGIHESKNYIPVKPHGANVQVGPWHVRAIPASHDVPCAGFVITHPQHGRALFWTDSATPPPLIKNLKVAAIETNYRPELLEHRRQAGETSNYLAQRVKETHLSIGKALAWITAQHAREPLEAVHLLHISARHGDPTAFASAARMAAPGASVTALGEKVATPSPDTVCVTRHDALAQYLKEIGLIDENTPILKRATPDEIRGKHAVGIIPYWLARYAASVTVIQLNRPADNRNRELSLPEVREAAGKPVTYRVEQIS